MSKYFTLKELTRSATADRLRIDNTPPPTIMCNLELLANHLLDLVRELWGGPIRVNNGYRCEALNAAVGGVATSQHTKGEAADITTGSRDGNRRLFNLIIKSGVKFDQLIDEKDYTWIHISYSVGRNRGQILHLK